MCLVCTLWDTMYIFFPNWFFWYFCIFLLFLYLCNRNKLISCTSNFFQIWFIFTIFLFFLHLLDRNSLAGLVHFIKIHFFIFFPIAPTVCRRNLLAGLVWWIFLLLKNDSIYLFFYYYLDFKHVHAFLFSNLNTPSILLGKETIHQYYVGLSFR